MTTESQMEHPTNGVRDIAISDEMRSSYLDYAMSVIVSRALPDARDGLKPVQRRILYAMYDQGMRPGASYKKSARLVGEVLGKYHPHGDGSIYSAMVRMAQPFSMNHMLVDGQGNFGSMDGDMPAAMRYTECRMAQIALRMLENIDQDTVDWRDNFDQSVREPSILPAQIPNLLLNGASGIAVGLATNIPPHNLAELCDGVKLLIRRPDATVNDLMEFVKGPDFPTGALIRGAAGIREAYASGRGRVVMEARYNIETAGANDARERIVFTEIPYQVNKADLVVAIADMITKRKLAGATFVRDESDRKGLRLVVELKRGASAAVVINNLFRYTKLRTSYNFNVIALVDGVPQLLTLKAALEQFIAFRREIIRRRTEFELKKVRARLHILEGLRIAIENLDAVIETIRHSKDVEEARSKLMAQFGMSEIQAQAVLDMQLRRIAALEREKIENEYAEMTQRSVDLQELLNDPQKITAEIERETDELVQRFGRKRRTDIHQQEIGEWKREDVEDHKEVVITLSKSGYIKRVDAAIYKSQHRGGKGVRGQRMSKEGDFTSHIQVADTHDTLLMFTNRGRVFGMRVFELPADQSRNARGALVQNLLEVLRTGETVVTILAVSALREDVHLMMATRRGRIKRIHLALLSKLRKNGLICFHLNADDELVSVGLASTDESIVMISRNAMSIHFNSTDIRERSRRSGARIGMRLNADDSLVAMCVAKPESDLLIVTEKGYGKISTIDKYRKQNPGGKGLRTLKITPKNGCIVSGATINSDVADDHKGGRLFLLTKQAQILRTNPSEIRRSGRIVQGVILAKPYPGDEISSIQVIAKREIEQRIISEDEATKLEQHENQLDNDADAPTQPPSQPDEDQSDESDEPTEA